MDFLEEIIATRHQTRDKHLTMNEQRERERATQNRYRFCVGTYVFAFALKQTSCEPSLFSTVASLSSAPSTQEQPGLEQ